MRRAFVMLLFSFLSQAAVAETRHVINANLGYMTGLEEDSILQKYSEILGTTARGLSLGLTYSLVLEADVDLLSQYGADTFFGWTAGVEHFTISAKKTTDLGGKMKIDQQQSSAVLSMRPGVLFHQLRAYLLVDLLIPIGESGTMTMGKQSTTFTDITVVKAGMGVLLSNIVGNFGVSCHYMLSHPEIALGISYDI